MSNLNINSLAKTLISKTDGKEANWNKTSRVNEFSLLLEHGSITISRFEDDDGINIVLSVSNSNFDEVYSLRADERNGSKELIELLTQLHTSAKNSYFKVEETISGILNELTETGVVGRIQEPDEGDDLPF